MATTATNTKQMTTERPKILCLGVSYADLHAALNAKAASHPSFTATAQSFNDAAITVDTVIQCVQDKIINPMDGRDLTRVVATEATCHVDVYCVSQEQGTLYRTDRHLHANFNRPSFVKKLSSTFTQDQQPQQYDQIILDYFWIPTGWDVHHWNKTFFETTLIQFAQRKLIVASPSLPSIVPNDRVYRRGIYLPFCLHCFQAIDTYRSKLQQYYNISYLRRNELHCMTLWVGTQSINDNQMQHILGKRIDQEEVYCTFSIRHIQEMESSGSGASKQELIHVATSLPDFSAIRFILLEPLPLADLTSKDTRGDNHNSLIPPNTDQRKSRSQMKVLSLHSPVRSQLLLKGVASPSSMTTPTSKALVRKRFHPQTTINAVRKSPRRIHQQSPISVVQVSLPSNSSVRLGKSTLQPKALFQDT
jgi:hypothetical protein